MHTAATAPERRVSLWLCSTQRRHQDEVGKDQVGSSSATPTPGARADVPAPSSPSPHGNQRIMEKDSNMTVCGRMRAITVQQVRAMGAWQSVTW